MLEELHVRDLALIEEAWLELEPGMTVLTGETGAGKTVLVGALQLLLGERADSSMVRAGAKEATVEGRFSVMGDELVASRRLTSEGRSRCKLGGEMSTVGALEAALGPMVDLHGQHEHQALLSPSRHVGYLDRFIGEAAATALLDYGAARDRHREALADRDALTATLANREGRVDTLRFQLSELEAANPRSGEDQELEDRLPSLRHAQKLAEAASEAHAATAEEGAAVDQLSLALQALGRVRGLDGALDKLTEELESLSVELDDVARRVRAYGEAIDHDPRSLEAAEARSAALSMIKKKYGPTLDDALRRAEEMRTELDGLESGEGGLAAISERVRAAADELRRAASELSSLREAAGEEFAGRVRTALADLALPRAAFEVGIEQLPFESWTADGAERVEFLFASELGEKARQLSRIASGGEVSRVMLALKSVLGGADAVPVLVFDEVDAGIGGATAVAVGRRLAQLADAHQVLVVTHLAQVAAFADHHIVVSREERDGRPVTVVRAVDGDDRVAEIARMLSGGDTEASLAHARELVRSASEG